MFIIIEPWDPSEFQIHSVALKKKMTENSEYFAMTARELQSGPFCVDGEVVMDSCAAIWELVYWPNERIAGMWKTWWCDEQGQFVQNYDKDDMPADWFENISWESAADVWMSKISSSIKNLDMAIG